MTNKVNLVRFFPHYLMHHAALVSDLGLRCSEMRMIVHGDDSVALTAYAEATALGLFARDWHDSPALIAYFSEPVHCGQMVRVRLPELSLRTDISFEVVLSLDDARKV